MNRQKIIDETNKITDELKCDADVNRAKEEASVKAYYEGYVDACEIIRKRISQMVYSEGE